jgi:hypothetical protein
MTDLADLVVQHGLFLATASDNDIHPDVAVEQLEALAFAVSNMSADVKAALRSSIRTRVERATEEERVVLEELVENLGLEK